MATKPLLGTRVPFPQAGRRTQSWKGGAATKEHGPTHRASISSGAGRAGGRGLPTGLTQTRARLLVVRSRRLLAHLSLTVIRTGDGGAIAGGEAAAAAAPRGSRRRRRRPAGRAGSGSGASPWWTPHRERRPASRAARPPPQGGGGSERGRGDPSGSLRRGRVRRRDGAGGCGHWKGTRPAAEAVLLALSGARRQEGDGGRRGAAERWLRAAARSRRGAAHHLPPGRRLPARRARSALRGSPQTRSSWGWRAGREAAVRARGHSAERRRAGPRPAQLHGPAPHARERGAARGAAEALTPPAPSAARTGGARGRGRRNSPSRLLGRRGSRGSRREGERGARRERAARGPPARWRGGRGET